MCVCDVCVCVYNHFKEPREITSSKKKNLLSKARTKYYDKEQVLMKKNILEF